MSLGGGRRKPFTRSELHSCVRHRPHALIVSMKPCFLSCSLPLYGPTRAAEGGESAKAVDPRRRPSSPSQGPCSRRTPTPLWAAPSVVHAMAKVSAPSTRPAPSPWNPPVHLQFGNRGRTSSPPTRGSAALAGRPQLHAHGPAGVGDAQEVLGREVLLQATTVRGVHSGGGKQVWPRHNRGRNRGRGFAAPPVPIPFARTPATSLHQLVARQSPWRGAPPALVAARAAASLASPGPWGLDPPQAAARRSGRSWRWPSAPRSSGRRPRPPDWTPSCSGSPVGAAGSTRPSPPRSAEARTHRSCASSPERASLPTRCVVASERPQRNGWWKRMEATERWVEERVRRRAAKRVLSSAGFAIAARAGSRPRPADPAPRRRSERGRVLARGRTRAPLVGRSGPRRRV